MGVALPLYGNGSQTLHTVVPGRHAAAAALLRARAQFDVVHIHAPYNPSSSCSRRSPCPPAPSASARTTPSSRRAACATSCTRPRAQSLRRLHGHIVVSEACIPPLDHYFPEFDWRVIPNGIDEEHFRPSAEPIDALRESGAPSCSSSAASTRATASASCSRRSSGCGARAMATRGCASSATARCAATTSAGSPREVARRRALGGTRRLEPPALLRLGRRLLHAVPAGELRDGAARGDELRPAGRREPDLGLRAAAARAGARACSSTPPDEPRAVRARARPPARHAGRAGADGRGGTRTPRRRATRGVSVAAELETLLPASCAASCPRSPRPRGRNTTRTRRPHPSDTMPGVGRLASSWLPPLAWMAIIFAFSSQHGGGHLPEAEVVLRKLGHVDRLPRADAAAPARPAALGRRRRAARRDASLRSPTRSATSGTSRSCPAAGATARDVAIDGIGIAPRRARRRRAPGCASSTA